MRDAGLDELRPLAAVAEPLVERHDHRLGVQNELPVLACGVLEHLHQRAPDTAAAEWTAYRDPFGLESAVSERAEARSADHLVRLQREEMRRGGVVCVHLSLEQERAVEHGAMDVREEELTLGSTGTRNPADGRIDRLGGEVVRDALPEEERTRVGTKAGTSHRVLQPVAIEVDRDEGDVCRQ